MRLRSLLVPIAVLTVAACEHATGVRDVEVLGTVEVYGEPLRATIPDTVSPSTPFDVSISTYGGGCIRKGTTETAVHGDTIIVTPYDLVRFGVDVACTLEFKVLIHSVTLSWPSAGELIVAVHGRVGSDGVERTYPHLVVVR
jgi:hypothetical protein